MPVYTFRLRDGRGDAEDAGGITLPNRDRAIRYAHDVVRELMRSRELQTRSWRLDVYEDRGERAGPICEISFASVDPTLDHLTPKFRTMVQSLSERQRLLSEVIHMAKDTIAESRALVARSRGNPYLATRFGKSIIRVT